VSVTWLTHLVTWHDDALSDTALCCMGAVSVVVCVQDSERGMMCIRWDGV
jgi:hypothetical protein